jgi:diketogulonate reductase-like aldo/keto reductase
MVRYGTEFYIACAIEDAGVERENLFLTTKLWPADYDYSSAMEAGSMSMKRLNTDYLDLYLLHWPTSNMLHKKEALEESWRALEVMVDSERCRAIGVSNFNESELEELIEIASIIPHVNQHEFHPYQNPKLLRQFCVENGIQFEVRSKVTIIS